MSVQNFSFLGGLEVTEKFVWVVVVVGSKWLLCLRGAVKKKNSIFVDIIQIKVDLPPSYPIFDKLIFDKVLIMLTSLPPLEFLTKIMKF